MNPPSCWYLDLNEASPEKSKRLHLPLFEYCSLPTSASSGVKKWIFLVVRQGFTPSFTWLVYTLSDEGAAAAGAAPSLTNGRASAAGYDAEEMAAWRWHISWCTVRAKRFFSLDFWHESRKTVSICLSSYPLVSQPCNGKYLLDRDFPIEL